ncbi:asparagine synthase-related protein, partial [Candidatus Venteria ishoeyi]|uniref:asparagine synthase-related protein n=1 Tax=Candidatus Venteria ishoeyi TaxID=1899563 RepID=UPI0015B0C3B9
EEQLSEEINENFKKYSDYLKDKAILLPLTAGYDSRLLACLLKEANHKNVICATWGRINNSEVETAKRVANNLGFEHVFVEYNSELISGCTKENEFLSYMDFSGHVSSMPFLQDYFAVKYLMENKIISKETVVLPGHSGDFFAGSHLDFEMENSEKKELLSRIIEKYGSTLSIGSKEKGDIINDIDSSFFNNEIKDGWRNFEKWDFVDRQGKFISNSNQIYSFFGIQFLMPLFDNAFISFFEELPFHQKINTRLYNTTLENYYFKPNCVDFDLKSKLSKKQKFAGMKKGVLKIAPSILKKMYYPLMDGIFYKEISEELVATSTE